MQDDRIRGSAGLTFGLGAAVAALFCWCVGKKPLDGNRYSVIAFKVLTGRSSSEVGCGLKLCDEPVCDQNLTPEVRSMLDIRLAIPPALNSLASSVPLNPHFWCVD
jgi:hypothetical protein